MLTCKDCGKINKRVCHYSKFDEVLCEPCYRTWRDNPIKYIPPKGEIHHDDEGKIICHECGRSYNKLVTHITTKHKMSVDNYKEKHGLNKTCKLTSESLREKFKNNASVDIRTVSKPFSKGHSVTKGKKKRLQTIKDRTGSIYKKEFKNE